MNNTKKILSGLLALAMTTGFTACGGGDEGGASGAADETTQAETVTTTAATVEINTETLAAEEADALAGAMDLDDNSVLGVAMGTSEAGGFVDGDGNIRKLDDTGQEVPITGEFLKHDSAYHLTVKNLIAVEMPETGGCGTYVYWLWGLALMLAALLLYKLPLRKEDC